MRAKRTWGAGTFVRFALAALAVIAAPAAAQAQQATISGRVTAAPAGEPLGEGRVMLVGTSLTATTNSDGRYTLRGVPTGTVEVRVIRVGYSEQKKAIAVSAGTPATLDFVMSPAIVQLQEIVTTATGEQRRVELGNSVATLGDVTAKVEQSPITDVGSLLAGKTAGVAVIPGSMVGAAPVVHIRGLNSLSLSNNPIYVIDGVRMQTGTINFGFTGTNGSFLNDIDPNEIEDIEIVKGPSAATLYGTDAANGVIVITTKKGHAGDTRWTWYGEGGGIDDRNDYPSDYATWGHDSKGNVRRCTLVQQTAGSCVADSVTSFNVLTNPSTSPYHLGHRDAYGMNASGGSDQVRFFVSGDLQEELGPYHMPQFAQTDLLSSGTPLRDQWVNPEQFQGQNIRVNLNASLSPKFDLNTNAGFSNTNQRLPQVDNNIFSVIYSARNNPGYNFNGLGYTETGGLGENLNGYGVYSPAQIFQMYTTNGTQRFIGSSDAQWRPFAWMQNSGTVGVDLSDNDNDFICQFNQCPASGTLRQGSVSTTQTNLRNFSAKLVSNSTWQARSSASFQTTFGADYVNTETDNVFAEGDILPPGGQTVGEGALPSASNRLQTVNKTLGLYAQEQLSLRDRMFLTIADRTDQNSSFGTNFQRVFYPKAAISWIISDEDFFHRPSWLNQLRLRSAYGASGVQPNGTQALQTFGASAVNIIPASPGATAGTDTPGLLANALGNPTLKPERSAELEAGFETGVLDNRVHFDATYYNKKTHDALINNPIAASSGSPALSLIQNLGSIQNTGVEANLNTTIIDRRALGWDITVAASHNTNKVLSLGLNPQGKPNPKILVSSSTIDSVGLPIGAWFVRPYTYKDANGDGIISPSEVTVGANPVYDGYSAPRDFMSVTNGVDLLSRKLRLTFQLDHRGGFNLFNQSSQFFCSNFTTCASSNGCGTATSCTGAGVADASLADQARNVANSSAKNPKTVSGYLENGAFWKLREVSAILTLPNSVAQRIRARDAQIVFSARNVATWTNYTGVDPEENYGTGNTQTDFATTAPRSYFLIRANLHY